MQKLLDEVNNAPLNQISGIMEKQRKELDKLATNDALSAQDKSNLAALFK
jgi:hypothetical protein